MAKDKTTEVATTIKGVSDSMPDWLTKGNAGSEDVSAADMILPRVDVLQALSPQLKKNDGAFIPGAEQGQIFNTVTGQIYGSSVSFVPVLFRKEWTVWKKRNAGGGFCGAHPTELQGNEAVAAMENPNDYECVETHQHFAMVLADTGVQEAVFSMTKSKIKVSRALNTLVQLAGVDRFAKAYRLDAIEVNGDKGDFWSFKAHPVGFVDKELYERGQNLLEMIRLGQADVDRADTDTDRVAPSAEL